MSGTENALAAIEGIVERGGDADDVLRGVVATLHGNAGYPWAAISFVEGDELARGPSAGELRGARLERVPVVWQGTHVAELEVGGAPAADRAFLERVADLVAGHCLVGWDTGGESWEP
jgi:hypothetical protein